MQYKNIIFDLGNVLVKLDTSGCMNDFKALGMEKLTDFGTYPEAKKLMGELGVGLISTEQFCEAARDLTQTTVSTVMSNTVCLSVIRALQTHRRAMVSRATTTPPELKRHRLLPQNSSTSPSSAR